LTKLLAIVSLPTKLSRTRAFESGDLPFDQGIRAELIEVWEGSSKDFKKAFSLGIHTSTFKVLYDSWNTFN
jgi:hypothetical protein